MKPWLEAKTRTLRRRLATVLVVGVWVPASAAAQPAPVPGTIDTILGQSPEQVVSALAAALGQQQMLQPGTERAIASAVMDALGRSANAGIRSMSLPLDSVGLANWVQPAAGRYISPVGGRYVMDAIVSEAANATTRLRLVPLFIAEVPESDGPLGGRPLPSAGVVERQILGAVMTQLSGQGR